MKRNSSIVIICMKWTFIYDFWIRVTAHPERNPNILKQIDIIKHNPLLVSLSKALDDYEDFTESPPELPPNSYSWRTIRLLSLTI